MMVGMSFLRGENRDKTGLNSRNRSGWTTSTRWNDKSVHRFSWLITQGSEVQSFPGNPGLLKSGRFSLR
jgi:hypothetical protein